MSSGDEVFNEDQFEQNVPDGIQTHYWHQARNRIIQRVLERIPGARDRALVEVGCGRGVVVEFLREHGWEVIGTELGEPQPITAEVAPYLHLGTPAAELPRDVREGASIVLLLDVLEHLAEPAEFLRSLCADFPACTHFVITLPARQELFSNYDRHYGHYLRYDRRTLGELADAAGLEISYQRYFFHALYPPAALLARLGVDRGVEVSAPSAATRLLHRTIGLCLASESLLLPARLPGTSLIATLEVPARS